MLNTERTGSGTPLVLVHGLGSSIRNWDPVLPMLQEKREVIAVDLPGFGKSEPLTGEVTIDTLTAAVERFLREEGLEDADVVGSSMGARMVVEMARRGHTGNVVALDPGGFWNDTQVRIFNSTITASIALVRRIQSILPSLVKQAAGRTALLAQFSAAPWKLDPDLVLTELRGFATSPSLDEARRSLAAAAGCAAGHTQGQPRVRLGPAGQGDSAQRSGSRHVALPGRHLARLRELRALPPLGPAGGSRALHSGFNGLVSLRPGAQVTGPVRCRRLSRRTMPGENVRQVMTAAPSTIITRGAC